MTEFLIKFFISIPIALILVSSPLLLWRLWGTQIDIDQSKKLWLSKQLELSSWIAIRDKNTIYQNGKAILKVETEPTIKEDEIIFPLARYISYWNEKESIEFRRFSCIASIDEEDTITGMEIVGLYKNIKCQIIR